ncbi:MAG: hypothetical protein ACK4UK_00280, partial [Flavobacterium sp.]
MKKSIILGVFLILLNSCANLPSKNIPHHFGTSETKGMIVGAIAFKNEKPIFNGYMFYYTGNETEKISVN